MPTSLASDNLKCTSVLIYTRHNDMTKIPLEEMVEHVQRSGRALPASYTTLESSENLCAVSAHCQCAGSKLEVSADICAVRAHCQCAGSMLEALAALHSFLFACDLSKC